MDPLTERSKQIVADAKSLYEKLEVEITKRTKFLEEQPEEWDMDHAGTEFDNRTWELEKLSEALETFIKEFK